MGGIKGVMAEEGQEGEGFGGYTIDTPKVGKAGGASAEPVTWMAFELRVPTSPAEGISTLARTSWWPLLENVPMQENYRGFTA